MIRHLTVKNFKSIKSKRFPFRKLNVLMGMNGQGKSSLIQSLLLLRQSGEQLSRTGRLSLNGNTVQIGTTRDALYQYAADDAKLGFELRFDQQDPISVDFQYKTGADYFQSSLEESTQLQLDLSQSLFTNTFEYVKSERIPPQTLHYKNYTSVVSIGSIGARGEFTVDYLETRGNEDVFFENLIHPKTQKSQNNKGEIILDRRLVNQVNLWLREISPEINLRTTEVSSEVVKLEYEFAQLTFGKTNPYKPENTGFGISYILPAIVAILKARPGDFIIIENPEAYIHPRGQAEIGRLLALAAENDVQLIIETHSDHIINGIRVAVKQTPALCDEVILFYFEKLFTDWEQYSRITNIEISQNGELSEYPPNLLEEWSNQMLKLL